MFRFRIFYAPDFTGREPHPGMGPKPHRLLAYEPAAAGNRRIRLALLKQLAEAVKIHVRQVLPYLCHQPGRRGL